MKKVLYLTNIEVPYRVRFFNLLAQDCDLTILFECKSPSNRNQFWSSSVEKKFKSVYLDGHKIGNENSFSFRILNYLNQQWDAVIVGCYNSKVQMLAVLYMRVRHIPYILSLDGEPFVKNDIKSQIKRLFLKNANFYLTAGKSSATNLLNVVGSKKNVQPYYFSSLSEEEVKNNSLANTKRESFVLVVGRYFDYKGMDVAFKVACLNKSIHYKFVGMGKRTDLFVQNMDSIPENVEIIPFLQKEDLYEEYQICSLLLLPTRQECWGLVINEAASFGTPIVSTTGSGAAVEFLANSKYEKYLAVPGNEKSLYEAVKECLNANDNEEYSRYLIGKSSEYSIEKSVKEHLKVIGLV